MNGSERSGARLFISYSRTDRPFVDQLAQALGDGGHDVWFDLQDIRPSEEWLAAIHAAIQRADAFVFVVSPDSVNSESVCAQEIDYATAHNKRIIPVVCRQVNPRVVQVSDAIGRLNWIFFLEAEGFTKSLEHLISAIETDLDWVRSHTRLLERAVEWDAAKRDDSFVLQKNDLSGAERWLALGAAKEPTPTVLQTEYVIESRAVATRRQRRLLMSAAIAVLLVGIGITVAAYQYLQAEDRRTQALSRELAAESRFETDRTLDRAIPLSRLALTARPLPESVDSAIAAGQASFGVVRFLRGHTGRVVGLCVVAGGRYLVSVGNDERVIVWDIAAGAPLRRLLPDLQDTGDAFTQVACSPSVPLVVIAPPTGHLTLWRIESDDAKLVADLEASDGESMPHFSGDGAILATRGDEGLTFRSGTTGEVVGGLRFEGAVSSLALSHSGHSVAIGAPPGRSDQFEEDGGAVSLWMRDRPKPVLTRPFPGLAVGNVAVNAEGSRITVAGTDGSVTAWEADGTEVEIKISPSLELSDTPHSVFDSNGEQLIVATGRFAVIMRSGGSRNSVERFQRLASHATSVTAVALSTAARVAATGSEEGTIMVHSVHGDDDLDGGRRLVDRGTLLDDVAFTPDGAAVVVDVSEPGAGRRVLPVPFASAPSAASANASAVQPKAPRFAVTTEGEKVLVKDSQGTDEPYEIVPEPGDYAVAGAVTPDGTYRVAASTNLVRIARAGESGTLVGALPAGFGAITAVAISGDGRLVAVAGGDAEHEIAQRVGRYNRSIVLIDTESGRTVGRPLVGVVATDITKLEFSRDGQRLLSFTPEEVIIWIVGTQLWLQRACATLAVAIDANEWERRLPGVAYPSSCDTEREQDLRR